MRNDPSSEPGNSVDNQPKKGVEKLSDPSQKPQPEQPFPRTVGPVSDLERHLPPLWWGQIFNSIYLKTDGDVVENEEITRLEVDMLLAATGLEPTDRVLDLCCGQGRHSLELARRGFQSVIGVDRSRYLIRLARRRAKSQNLNIAFHEGDARKVRLPEQSVDSVMIMGNSFGYFERREDDQQVLNRVKHVLRPGGIFFLDVTDGMWLSGNFEKRSWEWIDQNTFVCRERSLTSDRERLVSREVVVDASSGVIADQFYAERLYSSESLLQLLSEAGFLDIRVHGSYETDSERNQDLGMMARRLLVSCHAPQKRNGKKRARIAYPKVTVILGDPSLPDQVKLHGVYNENDLETVRKLKDALLELEGYEFSYHDNHASLLTSLRGNPPEFVYNLCDEGFGNRASSELHIPAYLEMLGIPYSGAGPACLALGYDKSHVRAIAQELEIPVPLESLAASDDLAGTIPSIYPSLIKPARGDGSLGITKDAVVRTTSEAAAYLSRLREELPQVPLLVQEYLDGPEYSVGIVGNPGYWYKVLPVLEVDYSGLPDGKPHILAYESKWDPDSPYWTDIRYKRAQLEESARSFLIDNSLRLFERLECRDYARVDFRTDGEGTIKLLEVNPNPGWCWDGKLAMMASFDGYSYSGMLELILQAAQTRISQGG